MTTRKTASKPAKTTQNFDKWIRQIPKGASSSMVTLQVPITLSERAWAVLAVDAAQRELTLNEHMQGAINSFLQLVDEDLRLTPKAA